MTQSMTDAKKGVPNKGGMVPITNAYLAKPGLLLGRVKKDKQKTPKAQRKLELAHHQSTVDRAREMIRAAQGRKSGSYLAVSTDEKGVVKTDTVPAPSVLEVGMAREFVRNALGTRPFKAIMTIDSGVVSSGANTAMNTSASVQMDSGAEWSSFAALFDEVRCLSWKTRYCVTTSDVVPPGTFAVFAAAAQLQTTITLNSLLVSTKHVGPIPLQQGGSAGIALNMVSNVTHFGQVELDAGPQVSGVTEGNAGSLAPVQGNWCPTTGTGYVVGYSNSRIEACGGVVVSYLRYFIYMTCEFRLRQ